ncbi:hypothetical protein F7725_005104 [Dissostichus mawsoni]|uniref:Uncharacterized protein n=1 Tax=Dissostichus mawsoni TaxID=36200 RepID=A0A7J5YSS7_DISMA|nr:hypothetical protein F7725_005104 [Dissostichus mawsoni]
MVGGLVGGVVLLQDSRKLNHFFSKLLPEGLLCEWLRPGGVTPPLVQLLVEKEAVHHGNVHKMVKKSLVANAVVSNQSVGHIHAAHAFVVVHHSVRNGNILSLPHTSLFHFPPDSPSAEGLVHCGAHGHFTAVHPLLRLEWCIFIRRCRGRLSYYWCRCPASYLSKLLPEGLLCEWLRPGGVTPPLVQLLVEKEAVHHGNVHKMVKKSLVANAVVSNQSVGHIHAAHAFVVVHHSVRNGNILSLPHTSLFHFPPDSPSAEGLVHCGAHGHFTAVHPLLRLEWCIFIRRCRGRLSYYWCRCPASYLSCSLKDLCEWLRPGGVTPPLVQLLVEKEAVHHGNVHKMVKKSLVANAVVSNQSVGHIHAAHAFVVVHHSVRNGNILSLPHTSLFHFLRTVRPLKALCTVEHMVTSRLSIHFCGSNVSLECSEGVHGQQAVQQSGCSVVEQQQHRHAPAEFPGAAVVGASECIFMVSSGKTKLPAVCTAQAVAVDAEGQQRPQQANNITACTTTELWGGQ